MREKQRLRMFENGVLRVVLGPKRDEVTGEWRKLHTEEPDDHYIIRVFKSRIMRRAGVLHVCWTGFWWGNPRERDHLEDIGVDGRIILNGSSIRGMWLRIGTGGGLL